MGSRSSSAAMLPRVGQSGKPFINAHAQRPPRQRVRCVPGMLSRLEVKVLWPI
jgi:hypothetical protein